MTAFVESRVIAFARIGWIEREKEHSSCSAEALLYSRRMPSFAESFRREDDKITAVFCDDVALFNILDFYQEVDVVGHDDEG
ncbi:MAG: hypothetical protein J6N18_10315 [Kiritimatiellae bacterium]|nr:hypothetical protein [Kiritimatiellia bacterium]